MVFGNLGGVLIYDGAWWTRIQLPNDSAVFAVAAGEGGRVGVGGVDDFGVVERGAYRSLAAQLPPAVRASLGEVYGVCARGHGFLFASDRYLIEWDSGALRIVAQYAPARRRLVRVGDAIYVVAPDHIERLGGPKLFGGRAVGALLPNGVVAIDGEGLFTLDGKPFAPAASAWLKSRRVVAGAMLARGRVAIGTRDDGVLIVDRDGNVEQRLAAAAGLEDTTLLSLFTDSAGALWIATFTGIARVDLALPLTRIDVRLGLKGSAAAVAAAGGRTYVGTSKGLFLLGRGDTIDDAHTIARPVAGVPPVWGLTASGDTLFAGTSTGVYEIRGDAPAVRVPGTEKLVVYALLPSKRDPSRMWIASRSGAGVLRRDGDAWRFDHLIAGSPSYTRDLVERGDVLWCGSIFDGPYSVDAHERVTRYGGGETFVTEVAGRLVFAQGNVVKSIVNGRVAPDPLLGGIRGLSFFRIDEDKRGDVWLNTQPPSRIRKRNDGTYDLTPQPLAAASAGGVHHLSVDDSGALWIGADRSLIRYDPSLSPPQPAPEIRGVAGGARLPYALRRLRVELAPLSYQPGLAFQSRLDPIDSGWSAWSAQPFIDFTTLDAGRYALHVRTRGASGAVSNEAVWRFEVLPPWYRTAWAWALWWLAAASLVLLIVRARTHALHRQAEELRALVAEQTRALERLTLEDELTGIANRRAFDAALQSEWERAARRGDTLAVIMLDLDFFKDLNDAAGHQAGDQCLRATGQLLAEHVRGAGDIVARYGGEEFAVLLPAASVDAAVAVAERLREGIAEACPVTASFGVAATVPVQGDDPRELIARSDRAMYAAKRAGRDQVCVDENGAQRAAL
ncbi:MAG TPA: diguanylate cyclase [Thermoanaerobaculia bacterium]|nr:diguanylate cyclase [Thermoanaerobaculia bacterium]